MDNLILKLFYTGYSVTLTVFHVKHMSGIPRIMQYKLYEGIKNETFYSKEEIGDRLSRDYIRGLIEGEGHFGANLKRDGVLVPSFVLKMHVRDKELIEAVRNYLGLYHPVLEYKNQGRHFAMIIIRDTSTLKNVIVPLFKNRLLGFKGTQFDWWLKKFPYLNSLVYR